MESHSKTNLYFNISVNYMYRYYALLDWYMKRLQTPLISPEHTGGGTSMEKSILLLHATTTGARSSGAHGEDPRSTPLEDPSPHPPQTPVILTPESGCHFSSSVYHFVFVLDMSSRSFYMDFSSGRTQLQVLVTLLTRLLIDLANFHLLPSTPLKSLYDLVRPQVFVSVLLVSETNKSVVLDATLLNEVDTSNRTWIDSLEDKIYQVEQQWAAKSAEAGDMREECFFSFTFLPEIIRFAAAAMDTVGCPKFVKNLVILSASIPSIGDNGMLESVMRFLYSYHIRVFPVILSQSCEEDILTVDPTPVLRQFAHFVSDSTHGSVIEWDACVTGLTDNYVSTVERMFYISYFQCECDVFNKNAKTPTTTHHSRPEQESRRPLLIHKHQVTTGLCSTLASRLKEGFHVQRIRIMPTLPATTTANSGIIPGSSQVELQLIYRWRPDVVLSCTISRAWPLSVPQETCNESFSVATSYFFLHELLCGKKSRESNGRVLERDSVRRFLHHWMEILGTNLFVTRLQQFLTDSTLYTVPESHKKSYIPLFHTPDGEISGDFVTRSGASLKFFLTFWRELMLQEENVMRKSMLHDRMHILLEQDSLVPTPLFEVNSFQQKIPIPCRESMELLCHDIQRWCSFIICEKYCYVRLVAPVLITKEEDESTAKPESFIILRTIFSGPECVLQFYSPHYTEVDDFLTFVSELKKSLSELNFPPRGRQAGPRTRHKSGHAAKRDSNHVPPFQRAPSDTPICVVLGNGVNRLMLRHFPFLAMPDLTSNVEDTVPLSYVKSYSWEWPLGTWDNPWVSAKCMEQIVATLVHLRLQEGFHFAHEKNSMLKLITSVSVHGPLVEESAAGCELLCQMPCYLQYFIAGLDWRALKLETPPSCSFQLRTVVCVEPKSGHVSTTSEEFSYIRGGRVQEIPERMYEVDSNAVSIYFTLENAAHSTTPWAEFAETHKYLQVNLSRLLLYCTEWLLWMPMYHEEAAEETPVPTWETRELLLSFFVSAMEHFQSRLLTQMENEDFTSHLFYRRNLAMTEDAASLEWRLFFAREEQNQSQRRIFIFMPTQWSKGLQDLLSSICEPAASKDCFPIFVYATSFCQLSFYIEDRWTYRKPGDVSHRCTEEFQHIEEDFQKEAFIATSQQNRDLLSEMECIRPFYVRCANQVISLYGESYVAGVFVGLQRRMAFHRTDLESLFSSENCVDLPFQEVEITDLMNILHKFYMQHATEEEEEKLRVVEEDFHERLEKRCQNVLQQYFIPIPHVPHHYVFCSPSWGRGVHFNLDVDSKSDATSSDLDKTGDSEDEDSGVTDYSLSMVHRPHHDDPTVSNSYRKLPRPLFLHIQTALTYGEQEESVETDSIPLKMQELVKQLEFQEIASLDSKAKLTLQLIPLCFFADEEDSEDEGKSLENSMNSYHNSMKTSPQKCTSNQEQIFKRCAMELKWIFADEKVNFYKFTSRMDGDVLQEIVDHINSQGDAMQKFLLPDGYNTQQGLGVRRLRLDFVFGMDSCLDLFLQYVLDLRVQHATFQFSKVDDFYVLLPAPSEVAPTPSQPPFWLFFHVKEQDVLLYFHHTDQHVLKNVKNRDCAQCELLRKIHHRLRAVMNRVNQYKLLEDLFTTKQCNDLLMPRSDEDAIWSSTQHGGGSSTSGFRMTPLWAGGEGTAASVSSSVLTAASSPTEERKPSLVLGAPPSWSSEKLFDEMKFKPGTFSCPRQGQLTFLLHPRLKESLDAQKKSVIAMIRNFLMNMTVHNRKNMLVVLDNDTNHKFYILLSLQNLSTGSHTNTATPTPLSPSPANIAPLQSPMKTANSNHESTPERGLTVQLNSSLNLKSSSQLFSSSQCEHLVVDIHGIETLSENLKQSLHQTLGVRLDHAVLISLSDMLKRNPLVKLSAEDIIFLMSGSNTSDGQGVESKDSSENDLVVPGPPVKDIHLPIDIGGSVEHLLLPYSWYLHQNLCTFLTPAKLQRGVSLQLVLQDVRQVGEAFLHNRTTLKGVANQGLAYIILQIVSRPSMNDTTSEPDSSHFQVVHPPEVLSNVKSICDTFTANGRVRNRSGSAANVESVLSLRVRIWERGCGEALVSQLLERIRATMEHSL